MLDLYCEHSEGLRFGYVPFSRAVATWFRVSSSLNGYWASIAVPITAYVQAACMLRKASEARVNRRRRRYYLIVLLLANVFTLAYLPLSSI